MGLSARTSLQSQPVVEMQPQQVYTQVAHVIPTKHVEPQYEEEEVDDYEEEVNEPLFTESHVQERRPVQAQPVQQPKQESHHSFFGRPQAQPQPQAQREVKTQFQEDDDDDDIAIIPPFMRRNKR